jgi:exopolyphosphatase/guanosine-5'-triphosphate,3'-diphosphate pyrophosphatase
MIQNADMPGVSRKDQTRLAMLVYAQRHSLGKIAHLVMDEVDWGMALALRLAILFYRNRAELALPRLHLKRTLKSFVLQLEKPWLERNLLAETMLTDEAKEWKAVGLPFKVTAYP